MNQKIVVFTGAGISAESGLGTFRDTGGIWEQFRIEDVCTAEAWQHHPERCVEFYNMRRRDALAAMPNAAHEAIARLQQVFPSTQVITQNIDNLHERAGSQNVLHLHGEITKLRSQTNPSALVDLKGWEQRYGECHADGSILRPHIVFFGEDVPNFPLACEMASQADIMIVVGTSLNVYPAASLLMYAPAHAEIYLIDPNEPDLSYYADRIGYIQAKATEGVPALVEALIEEMHHK
jgi:NAD-dependent deacetylase